VLVVQALRDGDDAGGLLVAGGGRGGRDRRDLRDRRDDGTSGGSGCRRLELGHARLQLSVLVQRLAPFDDDLVEEVVDLIRVESVIEANVLKLLVDYVIRGQCHERLLYRSAQRAEARKASLVASFWIRAQTGRAPS